MPGQKKLHVVEASYTRLANTTQYTADDALSDAVGGNANPLTFDNCCETGNRFAVISAFCRDSANRATKPSLQLYLFEGTAPTATNDNAEINISAADFAKLVGVIKFSSFDEIDPTADADGNSASTPTLPQPIIVEMEGGRDTIYGLVKVMNDYTPVSGESFTFTLQLLED